MSALKEKACDHCLNARTVVSENGLHSICTLSAKAATNCLLGVKDHFVLGWRLQFDGRE